mgnify:CR=1 FL=1
MAAGLFEQLFFNIYTKAFNKMYQRSGTLFQGRFKVRRVDSDPYLLHLCRYIHANPIKDGLVNVLNECPYSNYPEWIGSRNGTLVDHNFVNGFFTDRARYEQFVQNYSRPLSEELQYLEAL